MSFRILEKIVLWLCLLSTPGLASEPIQFTGEPIFIKDSLNFFHDATGKLAFNEVKNITFTEHPQGGFFPGNYWARGTLCLPEDGSYTFLHKDLVEGLEIYYGAGDSPKFRHHLPSMTDKMPNFWVRHDLMAEETAGKCQEYFFKFFSNDVLGFQLQFMSTADIQSEENAYTLLYAVYYAFLILVVLIAAIFYLKTRSLTYLFFLALIVTQDFLGTTMLNGFLTHYIMSPETMLKYDLGNIFALYMNISLVMFPIYFLNVKNRFLLWTSRFIALSQFLGSVPLIINFVYPVYVKFWWFSEFVNTSILVCCYWSLAVGLFHMRTGIGRLFVFGTGAKILSQVVKTLLLQGDVSENITIVGADFSFFVFNITAFGAIIEASVIICCMLIQYFRNIEEMSAKVKEAEKYQAIAESVQMLAHDLKKPFGNLLIGLENIEKIQDADKRNKFLSLLKQDVDQKLLNADRMTSEIINFGKPTNKVRQSENLSTIIYAAILSATNFVGKKGVLLNVKVASNIWVNVDNVAILRVFENLIVNALQHMSAGDRIEISAKLNGEVVGIRVRNTGSTIPDKVLPNIFTPFFTKRNGKGTGLGLSICKKILLEHDQTISCKTDDNSVTFSFSLPVAQGSESKTVVWPRKTDEVVASPSLSSEEKNLSSYEFADLLENAVDELGRPVRVAIIEDESLYRDSLINLLDERYRDQIEWHYFEDGADFSKDHDNDFFDLIIVDINLPVGPQGDEIIETARGAGVDGYICVHSSISKTIDLEKVGANFEVPKPMSRQALYCLISQAVKNRSLGLH